jgi:cytochrome c oxidase assembly protein subunit 15
MQQLAADTGTSLPPPRPVAWRRFSIVAWGALIYNLAVILWGALVRATGSGAGCGGHWPLCNGEVLPQVTQSATVIEFTHRIMSGVALVLTVAVFLWAVRIFPARHLARRWAAWSLVFMLTEALLGAALVLLGHVAKDESVGRIYSLGLHLVNTFLLLASLTLTARWASAANPKPAPSGERRAASLLPLAVLVVVAIAGAITALGDTLFPAHTLAEGVRADFASTANFLVRLRIIHPALAIAAAAFLSWLALPEFRSRRTPALRWLSGGLLALAGGEVLAGAANILLKAPLPMQLIHLLLADCLWITLVLFVSERTQAGGRLDRAGG